MDDLRELLELLRSHNVHFLVIGAHALAFNGYPRATKDIDPWVRKDNQNAERLARALKEFGADIGASGAVKFATSDRQMIRLGVPPHMVDVLNFAGATEFEEVWEGSVEGELLGIRVHYPSKTALIEMKRAAGRNTCSISRSLSRSKKELDLLRLLHAQKGRSPSSDRSCLAFLIA
ncbi:MAG TPA: hypothetical protein VM328_10820 [Fimbriimonadaceae bacterium]|nr:hypothetical protein [Fimbriimonadaceae bacterium]